MPRIAVGAAVVAAFVLGRWSVAAPEVGGAPGPRRVASGGSPPAVERDPARPSVASVLAESLRAAQAAAPAAPPPAIAAAAGAGAAEGPPPQRTRMPLAPEVEVRIQDEARAGFARLRPLAVESCWPRDGLPGGRRETTITYNVTFDPDGREVGRGMVEDRRAPAGEFARCLRRLQGTALSVSPTGTFVTVRLPVSYP